MEYGWSSANYQRRDCGAVLNGVYIITDQSWWVAIACGVSVIDTRDVKRGVFFSRFLCRVFGMF
jgi:hypothetical protein